MGTIWRMAISSSEDRQKQDSIAYKWSDYACKVSYHHCLPWQCRVYLCINDPCDAPYSTKDDERDLQIQGNKHVPNIDMKFDDQFPPPESLRLSYCSTGKNTWLQKLLCSYLTDLAQGLSTEIAYSVASKCMNLSTQQLMEHYCFNLSGADTILFSTYPALRESGYNGPVVIDVAGTHACFNCSLFHDSCLEDISSRENRRPSYAIAW